MVRRKKNEKKKKREIKRDKLGRLDKYILIKKIEKK